MLGGTTSPTSRTRPVGTHPLLESPALWIPDAADRPIVTPTASGLLVLVGLCGATREQVVSATRAGVPDDVAWRWPGAYVAVHLENDQVSIWTDLGALPIGLVRAASRLGRRETSTAAAEETVNAVRHFGFLPGRFACLESSVATVIALALQGRSVAWHHGVLCDPIVLHSWISVSGVPVAEPPSTLRCARLLTITSETKRNSHE